MSTTLKDKNSNGFPARSGVAAGDFISSAEMNQHLEALGERTNYLYTMGIYPHNATFNYPIGAFCQAAGVVYRAIAANAGKPPASNPAIWTRCPMTKDEIIADVNLGSYATTAQMNTGLSSKQNTDATLTALANLTTAADQIPYATGADEFAMTALTPFARTLLDDVNAAGALATLGAAPLASPALTGTPTAPTAAVGTDTAQIATMQSVRAESNFFRYKSGPFSVVAAGSVTLSHNKNMLPMSIGCILTCTAAEAGYQVGEQIYVSFYADVTPSYEGIGISKVTPDTIVVTCGNGGLISPTGKNGVPTVLSPSKWQINLMAIF